MNEHRAPSDPPQPGPNGPRPLERRSTVHHRPPLHSAEAVVTANRLRQSPEIPFQHVMVILSPGKPGDPWHPLRLFDPRRPTIGGQRHHHAPHRGEQPPQIVPIPRRPFQITESGPVPCGEPPSEPFPFLVQQSERNGTGRRKPAPAVLPFDNLRQFVHPVILHDLCSFSSIVSLGRGA